MLTDADVRDYYERTHHDVHRYASRLTGGDREQTEDLVQETYLTLVRQRNGGLLEAVDLGWAITTCRSRFIDQLRRKRTMLRLLPKLTPRGETVDSPTPATAALARVPADQRLALVMKYVDGSSVDEIAAEIGRSVHATESLLARGRQSLRTAYDADETNGARR